MWCTKYRPHRLPLYIPINLSVQAFREGDISNFSRPIPHHVVSCFNSDQRWVHDICRCGEVPTEFEGGFNHPGRLCD